MKTAVLIIALGVGLAAPGAAGAGLATMLSQDVPLGGIRALSANEAPGRFELVGVHWRGQGSVSFRTRRLAGGWSEWHRADPEGEDGPDRRSPESRVGSGWVLGNPWWVGPSNGIEYRTQGRVTALRAFFVRSRGSRGLLRSPAVASAPEIVLRAVWRADESIRREPPQVAPQLRFAIVHHTAGRNDYSRADVPAILRGIELYHVEANGWNDIGYNFLVDRFGTVYEGRYGGITKNVVGAHALGFNTGSVGVAVLGSYDVATPSPAVESALARLLAWRLDLAHVDPLGSATQVSGGSERYRIGAPVLLRAISGHRDTGLTACPGGRLYARLDGIAAAAARIGLPKLYEPSVSREAGLVRFRARLSSPRAWTVTVTDAAGLPIAMGKGMGSGVDWTWDSRLATSPASGLRWKIAAPGATGASGLLTAPRATAVLAITRVAATPALITPNGDGQADTATLTYVTSAPALVELALADASGLQVAELVPAARQPAGAHTFRFDGQGVADGAYQVLIAATDDRGATVTRAAPVTVSRTLGRVAVQPAVLTPNGDGRRDDLRVSFRLTAEATVRVRVFRAGAWVATPFAGPLAAGPQLVVWDGTKRVGRARDGDYTAAVEVTDAVATSTFALPFVTDATPPRVKLIRGALPSLGVSEPAILTLRVNGAARRLRVLRAGPVRLPGIRTVRTLSVVARDAAGNVARLRLT